MRKTTAVLLLCCLLLTVFSFPARGAENGLNELTMEQAVKMALKHSNTLKQADYDVDRSYEVKNLAETRANMVVPPGLITDPIWTVYTVANLQDLLWRVSDKSREVTRDAVVIGTVQKYIEVLKAREEADAALATLNYLQWVKETEQLKYQLGMNSAYGLKLVNDNYQKGKGSYEMAKIKLADAYRALYDATGIYSEEYIPLTTRPLYAAFDRDNNILRISAIIDDSPTVWISDHQVKLRQMSLDIYDWNNPQEPYEAKTIDVRKAELSADEYRNQLKQTLLTLANSIKQLEEGCAMLEQSLEAAKETLRVKKLMLELGMASRGDVLSAEMSVRSVQKDLNGMVYQHEVLKMLFEKPWLYTPPSGNGSAS